MRSDGAGQWRMRLLGPVVIAGVLCAGLVVVPEPAGAAEFRVHTWNVARGNRAVREDYASGPGFYRQGLDAIAFAVDYTYGRPVWSFSFQETCRHQMTEIARALNWRHGHNRYWADFGTTDAVAPVACEGYGNDYGNGILAIGVPLDGHPHTFQDPPPPSDPTKERKGVRCARMMSWGFNTLNCSTHFSAKSNEYALRNAAEAQEVITAWADFLAAQQIVGADFNIAYQPPLGQMPVRFRRWAFGDLPRYHEHDEAVVPGWRVTHDSNRMIDYVWVRRPAFVQLPPSLPCEFPRGTGNRRISDHGLCPGRFWQW